MQKKLNKSKTLFAKEFFKVSIWPAIRNIYIGLLFVQTGEDCK